MRTVPYMPHRRPRRSSAVSAVLGILCASTMSLANASRLSGQQRTAILNVRVVAAGSEADIPVARASVRVGGRSGVILTRSDGTARIENVPVGVSAVSVEAPGFSPDRALFTFEPGVVIDAAFVLEPAPIPLAGIDVQAVNRSAWLRMVGFYERAAGNLGTFLAPDDVAERAGRTARLSDLLRALPGLRVAGNPRAPGTYVLESRRGRTSLTRPCRPGLWLDGVPLGTAEGIHIDAVANPAELLALEVYDGPADVPSAFNGISGACGAVLLWTGRRASADP